jgi:hypothetical protein
VRNNGYARIKEEKQEIVFFFKENEDSLFPNSTTLLTSRGQGAATQHRTSRSFSEP